MSASFFSNFETYVANIAAGKVSEIALSHRSLDDDACRQLAQALGSNQVATVIDLQANHITSAGVADLCDALRNNKTIIEVNLDSNDIDDGGAESFIQLLDVNKTLVSIHLESNNVTQELLSRLAFKTSLNTQPQAFKEVVGALLENSPSISTLELCDVSNLSLSLLKTCLENNTQVRCLNLVGVAIGDPGCATIGQLIQSMKSLTHVNLSRNGITHHGVKILCDVLVNTHTVQEIILQGNKISDDSARMMMEMLRSNDSLTSLDISDNAVSMNALEALSHSLNLNSQPLDLKRAFYRVQINDPQFERIEFAWVPGMQHSAVLLAPVLKLNHVVKYVNLSNANFGDSGAAALAVVLKQNKTIECIEAANNGIGSEGGQVLAQALTVNNSLLELNLANNYLDETAGQELANMLMVNNSLVILNVEVNELSTAMMDTLEGLLVVNQQPRALKAILPSVEANSDRVTMIDFSQYDGHRYHNDASARVICRALRLNTVVTSIDMSHNTIGDEGAMHFAELFQCRTALDTVSLANCSIGDRGGLAMANALYNNTVLADLDLEGNCFGEETGQAFLAMLQKNDDLSSLILDRCRIGEALLNELRIACAINTQPQSLKALLPRLRSGEEVITTLQLSPKQGERAYGDSAVAILCHELQNNENLTALDLSKNEFGPEGTQALAAWIACPTTKLVKLDISSNRIGNEGINILAQAFCNTETLKEVDLRGTRFTQPGLLALIESLKTNDSIVSIEYTETNDMARKNKTELVRQLILNTQSVSLKRVLPNLLDNDPNLTELNLRGCGQSSIFGDTSAKLLALALARNSTITSVDLADNDVTSEGIEYIADMLEDNKSISAIDLSNNRIDDQGAASLSRIMTSNDAITCLNLTGNPISKPIFDELTYAIHVNNGPLPFKKVMDALAEDHSAVKELNFCGRGASRQYNDESMLILCSIIVSNSHVHTIDLSHNHIGDRGAQLLADTIRVNQNITKLNLSHNQITNPGGEALFLALKVNFTLVELNLDGNRVSKDILEQLEGPLMINKTPLKEPKLPKGQHKLRKKPEELNDDEQFRDTDYMHQIEDQLLDDAADDYPQLKDFQRKEDRERRQIVLSLMSRQKEERDELKEESPVRRIQAKHDERERAHLLNESPLRNMMTRQRQELQN